MSSLCAFDLSGDVWCCGPVAAHVMVYNGALDNDLYDRNMWSMNRMRLYWCYVVIISAAINRSDVFGDFNLWRCVLAALNVFRNHFDQLHATFIRNMFPVTVAVLSENLNIKMWAYKIIFLSAVVYDFETWSYIVWDFAKLELSMILELKRD